jgi:ADP-dependent phosphofructokinase/glucokinase
MNVWENRMRKVTAVPKIDCRTLTAFNVNIDAVVKINPQWVDWLVTQTDQHLKGANIEEMPRQVGSLPALIALLHAALKTGKSFYGGLEKSMEKWCRNNLSGVEFRVGGQAGIIANLMALLRADSRLYTYPLSDELAYYIHEDVKVPLYTENTLTWRNVRESGDPQAGTKVNWIFEYPKGVTCHFPQGKITTPRANRLILGSQEIGALSCFMPPIEQVISKLGAGADVAFMAGYHRGVVPERAESLDEFISLSRSQLIKLKADNPHLVVHIEYVPTKDPSIEAPLWLGLAGCFDSYGINENELPQLLTKLGEEELGQMIKKDENAYTLWKGAKRLQKIMGVTRLHLHNLGYYVLLLKEPYPVSPQTVRDSCLLASTVNAAKAMYGEVTSSEQILQARELSLSLIGTEQIKLFAAKAGEEGLPIDEEFEQTGITRMGDHSVIVMPAHVYPNPVSTVGMGDTISSVSLGAEVAAYCQQRKACV